MKAIINEALRVKYTEQELVAGCRKNSRIHQHALYNTYSRKMFAVCLRYASCREEAEDFLQEGFVKVFSRIEQFNGDGSFEGWVRRVMVTTALQHLRKQKAMPVFTDVEKSNQIADEGDMISNMAADELLEIIQKLPAGYRMVFNLYVIEELPHKEVAEQLGITEGTSKSQLARARAMLQKLVKSNENIQYTQRAESAR